MNQHARFTFEARYSGLEKSDEFSVIATDFASAWTLAAAEGARRQGVMIELWLKRRADVDVREMAIGQSNVRTWH